MLASFCPFRFYKVIVHNFVIVALSRCSAMMPADLSQEMLMSLTRREMCLLLPAFLPAAAELQAFAREKSLPSGAFSFDNAPLHVASNNCADPDDAAGRTGYRRGHRSAPDHAAPGGAPTATTHHHPHSGMWLIREGTIELTVIDRKFHLEPGSVGFVASNEEHGILNIGTTPALYFVVAVGPGAELQE